MIVMVAVFALPAIAQSFTTDERQGVQTTNFQSTSTMAGSGSVYTPNPTLNSDGTAYDPSASSAPSAPRRAKMDEPSNPGTPGIGELDQPVGDEMVPLLIISMLYVGYLLLRRRREATR